MQPAPAHALVCLISGRNLGDAAIHAGQARELMARGFAQRLLVWTRPASRPLFEAIDGVELVCSPFPVGTGRGFDARAARAFLAAGWSIRALRPALSIDLVGDFRERWIARLVGAPLHRYPIWPAGHPFGRAIRNPFGTGGPGGPGGPGGTGVPVVSDGDAAGANVYAALDGWVQRIAPRGLQTVPASLVGATTPRRRIGLHPFASLACKHWPAPQWQALAQRLHAQGHDLVVYGAPGDRERLVQLFEPVLPGCEVVTLPIAGLAQHLRSIGLLVGLDSFAVHLAALQGCPSVTINACATPGLFTPPGAGEVSASGGCAHYPCMNVPRCEALDAPYACIRSVTVEAVLQEVERTCGTIRP